MIFNRPFRIVIIDDDECILNLIWKYLSQFSGDEITFSAFSHPEEALAFIEEHQVHIVITDLQLEDKNGADVISKCLEMQKGIQVIALSADKKLMTAIDCFNRGAKYYLDKPIDKVAFRATIRSCIDFLDLWHELLKNKVHHHHDEEESTQEVVS
jgi:DNA-binding NtrC family response regulator